MGCLYRDGKGTKADAFTAGEVVPQISEAGNHHAHHNLGIMFERGLGVKPDIRKALEHYEQALNAGNVYSMNAVAWLFEQRQIRPTQPETGREVLYAAAERGYSMACTTSPVCISMDVA